MPAPRPLEILRLEGPAAYRDVYARQIARRDAVARGEAPEALFLLEHAPTVTLGRKSQAENVVAPPEILDARGVTVVDTDRGGDVTYHGPGQLVAYPVLNLESHGRSVNGYLRRLEQVIIDTLGAYGLRGELLDGFTGVWVDGAKVAAIGIGIHQWVSYHGISLNVNPDMAHWQWIVPCGIPDKPVTSLEQLLESPPKLQDVREIFAQRFLDEFGFQETQ